MHCSKPLLLEKIRNELKKEVTNKDLSNCMAERRPEKQKEHKLTEAVKFLREQGNETK